MHNKLLSRRQFLVGVALSSFAAVGTNTLSAQLPEKFVGATVFDKILDKARNEKWSELPIGELMGKIAMQLEGVPYKGGTLDASTAETCTVNLCELDCVTFVETTLNFARMLKHGKGSPEALLEEVRFTRYRNGKQGDYTSRLHYTSDWLLDNERKGVLKLLTDLPGAEPFSPGVNFMSTHPQSYRQLASNPAFVERIRKQEEALNKRMLKFVPTEKLSAVEPLLQTGDIVGLCGRVPGLDIEHTGLVIRKDRVAHFMDASSKKANMKVTLEKGALHEAIASSNKIRGVVFARPI